MAAYFAKDELSESVRTNTGESFSSLHYGNQDHGDLCLTLTLEEIMCKINLYIYLVCVVFI